MDLSAYTENSDVLIWVENILKSRTTFLKLKIFDVLIWVENVLKNWTTVLKLKMFLLCLKQDELAIFTLFISTNKLSVQLDMFNYQKVVK